jgi:hypothetical protein
MNASRSAPSNSRRAAEARRYRRAAEDALQQLDWCIGYLHGIGKPRVSRALSRNRDLIRTQLMREPEQPLPQSRAEPRQAAG